MGIADDASLLAAPTPREGVSDIAGVVTIPDPVALGDAGAVAGATPPRTGGADVAVGPGTRALLADFMAGTCVGMGVGRDVGAGVAGGEGGGVAGLVTVIRPCIAA
jgi:hypothetical protein